MNINIHLFKNWIKWLGSITIVLLTQINVVAAPNSAKSSIWVAPYHPCYQWDDVPAADVPWNKITHLILGYLGPEKSNAEWTLGLPGGWARGWDNWRTTAQGYVTAGHTAGRKVTCMLGGAGSNPDSIWNKATTAANIDKFASNIKAVLQPIGFDGVDLDWENEIDYPRLVALTQKIRTVWPEAIITIPTDFRGDDASKFAAAQNAVDAFMPMTYLDIPQWGGWRIPVPLTPLHGVDRPGYGTNPYSIDCVLDNWTSAGVPASKIVMGVGGFGSVWGDINHDNLAPITPYANTDIFGAADGETYSIASDNTVTWKWVKQVVTNNLKMIEAWDDTGKCSYWHSPATNDFFNTKVNSWDPPYNISLIFYETPRSISEKVSYINSKGMKGMMFWTLSQMMDGSSCPILETATSVEDTKASIITEYALYQNYPNPFNPSTVISYSLSKSNLVSLKIYDLLGKEIKTLINEQQNSGNYSVTFNARNLSSGIYFYKLQAGSFNQTKKFILLK
jgi:GH18 family chitinase